MLSIPPQLLRTVLLFSLGSALLLSNALTWYIGQSRQVASLRDAYFERIFWLSFSMSDKATELVDTSNWAGLEIHFSVLKSNPEVVYLFLRGMDDEILYAYDEDVVEEYDPEIIVWDVPKAAILENRGIVGDPREYQSGKYELREQVLLKDAEVQGELRARVGERVFEAKRELQHWGEPVGILHIGFSKKPLQENVAESQRSLLVIELLLLLFGLLLSGWVARRVAKPLERITEEQRRIQDLRLDGEFELKSPIVEVDSLSRSLGAMRTSLRAFQIYMPAELVRELILRGEDAALGGQERELSILFVDIAGFTSISEELKPEELMLQLSEYLGLLAEIIRAHSGTVDKYLGDGVMAFWGAPVLSDHHASDACRAALECRNRIQELNEDWQAQGKKPFWSRIGIHTGNTLVGNVGSANRMNYTVVGDSVNLASRLEGINKIYQTNIIVSSETQEEAGSEFLFRPLDTVRVKGKQKGVEIFELIDSKEQASEKQKEFCAEFSRGVWAYNVRRFDQAHEVFKQLSETFPDDVPTQIYLRRSHRFSIVPPSVDWEPVIDLEPRFKTQADI